MSNNINKIVCERRFYNMNKKIKYFLFKQNAIKKNDGSDTNCPRK